MVSCTKWKAPRKIYYSGIRGFEKWITEQKKEKKDTSVPVVGMLPGHRQNNTISSTERYPSGRRGG